jgi:hypothetical protein
MLEMGTNKNETSWKEYFKVWFHPKICILIHQTTSEIWHVSWICQFMLLLEVSNAQLIRGRIFSCEWPFSCKHHLAILCYYLKAVMHNGSVDTNKFLPGDVINGHNQEKILWKECLLQKNNFSIAKCWCKTVHVNSTAILCYYLKALTHNGSVDMNKF